MSDWKEISQEDAARHSLYGIGGWLLVWGLGWLLSIILVCMQTAEFAAWFENASPDVQSQNQGTLGFNLTRGALFALFTAFVFAMMITKWNPFRVAATVVVLVQYPLKLIAAALWNIPHFDSFALREFLPHLGYCVVWVLYLQGSRRVRVTFERRVPANDVERSVAAAS